MDYGKNEEDSNNFMVTCHGTNISLTESYWAILRSSDDAVDSYGETVKDIDR